MKIDIRDKEKVDEALKVANARVRNATHQDVESLVSVIERYLERTGLRKECWTGLRFRCNPNAATFSTAYKGIPTATYFTLERYSGAWFLVGVERRECGTRRITLVRDLSEEQKQGVLGAFYRFEGGLV